MKVLRCRRCGLEQAPVKLLACPKCFAPLDAVYDYDSLHLSREAFLNRPRTLWRYRELLPIEDEANFVDLNAGGTPLQRCRNLEESLGLHEVYVKNDTVNPTNSFKDRPAAMAVSKTIEFGLEAVGAVSTGNLAAAVAAHAAKGNLPCYIFIPSGIEQSKIAQIEAYGARIISVRGTYDEANRLAYLASESYGWAIANITMRPYYVEGSKTMAYEICEQLGWKTPDHLIVPVASGALLRALWKGFVEFEEVGLIDHADLSIHGAQADGCAPVARAFEEGTGLIRPVESPNTIAKSIAIGDPGDGTHAIEVAKKTGGTIGSVSDKEIVTSIRELSSREGIFAEPAGAVTIALLKRLRDSGKIRPDESVVCCVTGNGLKSIEAVYGDPERWITVEPTLHALNLSLGGRRHLG